MTTLLCFYLFAQQLIFAQETPPAPPSTQPVRGQLLERGTKKPLADVNIFILPHKLKTTTDTEGRFVFPEVPQGEFEFIVNKSGSLKLTSKSTTAEANNLLYLEKESYKVFETTVTALAEKRDVTRKGMSQKEFLVTPGAQDDPIKAIQNLPGIANQSVSAQVVIQGSSPDDTRYTLNGHEIPIVFHFGGISSVVMPQAVDTVDYLAGGYGPEYGRALGGIVNLTTRAPKNDRWHGMGFVDIYNIGALVEGPIDDKSSLFLSGRYSYIGQVFKQIAKDNDGFDLTVAPAFSDIFMDYHRQVSPIDEVSLVYVRSKDELSFVLNESPGGNPDFRGDFYQRTQFYRVIPRWRRKLGDRNHLDVSLGYGDNDILFEIGDNYFDLQSSTLSARAEYKSRISENYTYYLGLDSQRQNFNVRFRFPTRNQEVGGPTGDVITADVRDANWEHGVYLRNRITLLDEKWVLSPNLRVSQFSATDETFLQPRLSTRYRVNPSLTYTFASGLYYQAPQNGEATANVGNPDAVSEKATHISLGFEKDFRKGKSNGVVLASEVFYKDLYDLIVNTSATNSDGTPKNNSNDGTGKIYGLQAQVKWQNERFRLTGAYTFINSRRTDPSLGEFPSEFDQTHNFNLIASVERKRWIFSTRLRYVTGKPVTPINGGIFDNDKDVYIPINGDYFSNRLRPFVQFDIRVDRKWVFNNWILSAYFDIQNVTDAKNVEAINYNYDFTNSTETTGLPLLPIFGVKGEF